MTADDYAPCRLVEHPEDLGDPRYALLFDSFESTEELLEEKGLSGGGYTWHGIVDALMRKHYPQKLDGLDFDPESSMFCVCSSDLDALRAVAECVKMALADTRVLEQAVDEADESIIE